MLWRAAGRSYDLLIILSPLAKNIALHKFTPQRPQSAQIAFRGKRNR